jgi:hypothetical protein
MIWMGTGGTAVVAAKSGMIVYRNVQRKHPYKWGVLHFLIVYLLYGGCKLGRAEFIPVYMI